MAGEHDIITALIGSVTGEEEQIAADYVEPALLQLDEEEAARIAIQNETSHIHTPRDTQPNGRPHHIQPAEHSLTSESPARRY